MRPHDNGRTTRRTYGAGSLWERADKAGRVTWYGQWRHNGVQVKRRIGPREELNRRQAEAKLRELMGEVEPTPPASEALTIAELGRRYVAEQERKGRKKATRTAIDTAIRIHFEPYFGKRSIASVTYEDVADLATKMRDKGLAPKTIHNYIGTLRTLYTFAMHPRRKWATSNPCMGVELDAVPRYEGIRYLQPDDIELMVLHAQPGDYQLLDATMFRTAAMTGLRLGELIALRWRDVDWNAKAIRVQRSIVLGELGSPKSRR